MKKDLITVRVGADETFTVDAILVDEVPGLAIHREVVWNPSIGGNDTTNRWTTTHVPSGLSVWKSVDRAEHAMNFAKSLKDLADWSQVEVEVKSDDIAKKFGEMIGQQEKKETGRRYVVRKSKQTGFDVIDTTTDQVVDNKQHRGIAAELASNMNLEQL